jgi:tape measure domain-containing protein
MSKTVDVDLRIRAKNLTKSTLGDIADDVDKLTKSQEALSTSSGLASRGLKDLVSEQERLASITKELERRKGLVNNFSEQRAQVVQLSQKLRELTEVSRQAAAGQAFGSPKQFAATNAEIARTQAQLQKLATANTRAGESLKDLGIDTKNLADSQGQINTALTKSNAAYATATRAIEGYNAATARTAQVQAEAQRRIQAEQRVSQSVVNAAGSSNRNAELSALRKDIELRSAQARSLEIAAEAQRRLAAEQAREIAQQPRATQAVRDYISVQNQRYQRQRDLQAAFGAEFAARQREEASIAASNARRERLVALLQTERAQKILSAEASRAAASSEAASAASKERQAKATRDSANALKLFDDTGRKSLSTYQRIRGQVLALTSAYIGVYQAINTVQKAIEATNRNDSLQIGLRTVNNGDTKAAAADYQFLRQEAERLGLVFDDLAPQYANVAASGKALGLSTSIIRGLFSDTAQSAAAMNLSVEDSEGVFRALTQIMSKGKVQAEELRGQLGDRLPGAVVRFANANGIALDQLDKMLEQGQVGVDFVIRGIQAYANSYDAEMGNITNRLQAYINRATNAYNDWLRTLLSGENQTRLKEAFQVITDFFRSQDGADFAEGLGNAFAALVDLFVSLAKNIDLVILAAKSFFAIMSIKAIVDIGLSVKATGAAFLAFRTQVLAAAAGTGAMSVAARGLSAALGPLGIAITAVAGLFLSYRNYLADADEQTDKFIGTLNRARKAQGTFEIGASLEQVNAQIKANEEALKSAQKTRDDLLGKNGIDGLTTTAKGLFGGGALTAGEAENDVAVLLERQNALRQTALNLQKRQTIATKEEAEQRKKDEAELKKLQDENAKKNKKKEKTPKTPKGPDPEDVESRATTLIADLQAKIAQTDIDTNARTLDQIESNFEARKTQIESQVVKFNEQIAKIQRDADKSNRGKGVDVSGQLTTLNGLVSAYSAAAAEQAEMKRATEGMTLLEGELNRTVEDRQNSIELINAMQQAGAISYGEAWRQTQLAQETANTKILENVAALRAFLATIDPNSDLYVKLGVARTLEGLKLVELQAQKLTTIELFQRKFGDQIAAGFGNVFGTLAEGFAHLGEEGTDLGDVFNAAGDAFRNFAADFLTQIAQMIAQAIILQAIQNALGNTSGGYWNAAIGALTGHTGGVVSGRIGANRSKQVNPMVFAGAAKFHSGGFPGLRQDEVPAILKKGEEVLNERDPRNALNGGMMPSGGAPVFSPTIVNTIDSVDVIKQGLPGGGMNAIINQMGKNKNAIRKQLGID